MARTARTQYVCANCGAVSSKWQGRCESCGEWNTMTEEAPASAPVALRTGRGRPVELTALSGATPELPRTLSGIGEFDRVVGGGLVPGSAILVGGDPGIGKSTILIQVAASLARAGNRVVYVSGEEAIGQIRLRAERLGLRDAPVALAAETHVEDILATLQSGPPVDLVVIDSIQTLWTDIVESAPGTVTQVRTSVQALIRLREGERRDDRARRPCHQGRADRRPAGGRAHGRRGALFRGRHRPAFSPASRGEEPLRAGLRDRRFRDDATPG